MNLFPLPPLTHLRRLSDDTGVLQFATHSVPNPHFGYTLDDNARALLVTCGYYHHGVEPEIAAALAYRALAFIHWAQKPDGCFHNQLNYARCWLDEVGSEDALGRAVWALGYAAACPLDDASKGAATIMFERTLAHVPKLRSLRSRAYAILGIAHLVRVGHKYTPKNLLAALADSIVHEFDDHAQPHWHWFEAVLSYDNGRLPQALLIAGHLLQNNRYLAIAQQSLEFLLTQVIEDNILVPVGQDGWYRRFENKARYDQQPIDAASIVEVCATANIVLCDRRYQDIALAAWAWFHGRNSEGLPLYNPETTGCHDGLKLGSVNQNQGSESALALLQAALALNDSNWLGVNEDQLIALRGRYK